MRHGACRKGRFDTTRLSNPEVSKKFAIFLKNRFSVLQNNAEMTIYNFNKAIEETSKEILGYQKRRKEEWTRDATWTKIDEWKLIKRKLLNAKSPCLKEHFFTEYSKKDKEVKWSCRRDKRHYIDTLATEAETAARNNDMRTLYKITKK